MPHKWKKLNDGKHDEVGAVHWEATWRREDVEQCVVDIFKYSYHGSMTLSKCAKKPYSVCVYAKKAEDFKYVHFRLLREATQYADTMLRLNSLK